MFAFVVTPLTNKSEGEGGVIYLRITVFWGKKKCLRYIFNGVVNAKCLILKIDQLRGGIWTGISRVAASGLLRFASKLNCRCASGTLLIGSASPPVDA